MTVSAVTLVFEGLVAVLLALTIFFVIRLNQRMTQLRDREQEMQRLVDGLNQAAVQAEASTSTLTTAGAEAEKSLRACLGQAQSMRDELDFLIDRGDRLGQRFERARPAPGHPARRGALDGLLDQEPAEPASLGPSGDDDRGGTPDGGSRAERELFKALLSARTGDK